jgi:hypothetical protein
MKRFTALLMAFCLLVVSGASGAVLAATSTAAQRTNDATPAQDQDESRDDEDQTSDSDDDATTKDGYPKKRAGHSTWEKVAALPGFLVYIPMWLVFNTAGIIIYANDKYNIGAKAIDALTTDDGRRGVYPTYSSRAGVGLTFYSKDYLNEGSRFTLGGSYGLKQRQRYKMRYRRIDLFGGALTAGVGAQFHNMPDERFFGFGPDAKRAGQSNFQQMQSLADVTLGKRLTKDLQIDLKGGIEHNKIETGESTRYISTLNPTYAPPFSTPAISHPLPGSNREVTMLRGEITLEYDGTNRPVRPSSGITADLAGGVAQGNGEDDIYAFTEVRADVSLFLHLFHDRILQLRAGGQFIDPLDDKLVPFYSVSALGHAKSIRGFQRGRYRDLDAGFVTAEYRWPIWRVIDALLFADFGQVSSRLFSDWDRTDVQTTFGGGFRYWASDGGMTRIEVAKSIDGWRFHLIMN